MSGTILDSGIPAASATPALTSSSETNGSRRTLMTRTSSRPIPATATDSRYAVLSIIA